MTADVGVDQVPGELPLGEMPCWDARPPGEVSLLNDEFFFITAFSGDVED